MTRREDQIIDLITPWVIPLGYDVVAVEVFTHRQKKLVVYIDRLAEPESDGVAPTSVGSVGIEDCVRVSRTIDELLDRAPEVDSLFPAGYELEVSSPGLERPLRRPQDFVRFKGKMARIQLFRPLEATELGNADYWSQHQRQKNYSGRLNGFMNETLKLVVSEQGSEKKGGKKSKKPAEHKEIEVSIPFNLITKAHLEIELE